MTGEGAGLDRLAAAAMRGDAEALDKLMALSWDMAFRLGARLLCDRVAAQDVAQAACERVLRSLRNLRSAGAYKAWFYSIVARIALRDRTILLRQRNVWVLNDRPVAADPSVHVDPTDSIVVNAAIDRLEPQLRYVVILFYGCDLPTADIARSLNLPGGTVRYRLHEARKQLRALLESGADKESVGA